MRLIVEDVHAELASYATLRAPVDKWARNTLWLLDQCEQRCWGAVPISRAVEWNPVELTQAFHAEVVLAQNTARRLVADLNRAGAELNALSDKLESEQTSRDVMRALLHVMAALGSMLNAIYYRFPELEPPAEAEE